MSALDDAVDVVNVPDDAAVWLAVSAGNYHDADMALWVVKQQLGDRELTPSEQAHLDQLRQRRKDTYADLVIWVMTVEAQRVGAGYVPPDKGVMDRNVKTFADEVRRAAGRDGA